MWIDRSAVSDISSTPVDHVSLYDEIVRSVEDRTIPHDSEVAGTIVDKSMHTSNTDALNPCLSVSLLVEIARLEI